MVNESGWFEDLCPVSSNATFSPSLLLLLLLRTSNLLLLLPAAFLPQARESLATAKSYDENSVYITHTHKTGRPHS